MKLYYLNLILYNAPSISILLPNAGESDAMLAPSLHPTNFPTFLPTRPPTPRNNNPKKRLWIGCGIHNCRLLSQ